MKLYKEKDLNRSGNLRVFLSASKVKDWAPRGKPGGGGGSYVALRFQFSKFGSLAR